MTYCCVRYIIPTHVIFIFNIFSEEAVPVADVSNDCHDEVIIDDGSVQNVDQMDNESRKLL